jgi:hypothetical protein
VRSSTAIGTAQSKRSTLGTSTTSSERYHSITWLQSLWTVVLTTESLVIRLDAFKVGQCHEIPRSHDPAPQKPAPTCPFRPEIQNHGRQIVMTLAIQIKRLDGRRILLSPDGRDLILPVNLNRARTSSTPLASRTVGMKRYSPRAARSASLLGRKRSAKVRFANFCR